MATLLDIGNEMRAFLALLDETNGELTPETEAALDAFFAEISTDQAAKVDGYCALIRNEELVAAARREEVERLQNRISAGENFVKRLKLRLKEYMELTGQKNIETRRYKVGVVNNGGVQTYQMSCRPEQLPEEYTDRVIQVQVKSYAIREALVAGKEVPGCNLQPRGTHLRIS